MTTNVKITLTGGELLPQAQTVQRNNRWRLEERDRQQAIEASVEKAQATEQAQKRKTAPRQLGSSTPEIAATRRVPYGPESPLFGQGTGPGGGSGGGAGSGSGGGSGSGSVNQPEDPNSIPPYDLPTGVAPITGVILSQPVITCASGLEWIQWRKDNVPFHEWKNTNPGSSDPGGYISTFYPAVKSPAWINRPTTQDPNSAWVIDPSDVGSIITTVFKCRDATPRTARRIVIQPGAKTGVEYQVSVVYYGLPGFNFSPPNNFSTCQQVGSWFSTVPVLVEPGTTNQGAFGVVNWFEKLQIGSSQIDPGDPFRKFAWICNVQTRNV